MKKTISLFILLITIISTSCLAVTENEEQGQETKNIELNITDNIKVDSENEIATITISLGKFTGVSDNCVLGYEAVIDYDTNVFKNVKVTGLNGWVCNYEDSTKILIGDVDSAKANTDIAKLEFTFADNIAQTTTSNVKFNNIELTDGTNDFVYNKETKITIEKQVENDNPTQDENGNGTANGTNKPTDSEININTGSNNQNNGNNQANQNSGSNQTTTNQSTVTDNNKKSDETVSNGKIPQTGENSIIAVSIIILVGVMVVSRVCYNKIKLK